MNADTALGPLRRALTAHLAPGEWERFGVLLDNLESAWSAADAGRIDNAATRLDRAVRRRASRFGEEPPVPITPPVRERVNRMVHVLTDAVGSEDRLRDETQQTTTDTGH